MTPLEITGIAYDIVRSSDPIQMPSKTGSKTWMGYLVRMKDQLFLTSSWFNKNDKTGKTSVTQYAEPYPVAIKNVGKANETTLEEQANSEFDSMVKKEIDKRMSDRPLPMLAHKFQDRGAKYIQYPCAVQPKLNGMRMLSDGRSAWSRGGKDIIPECVEHLQWNAGVVGIIDGELILPGNVLLQETMKATKKYRDGVSNKLQYHVYDVMNGIKANDPFRLRTRLLKDLVASENNPNIIFVETRIAVNYAEIMLAHHHFISQGYEGTMVRNLDSVYEINQRSNSLQKLKDMQDAEFRIVDVIEGDGSFKGCAIFVCDNGEGRFFNCTPEGSTAERKAYFHERALLIGQYLTVRYQELSKDQIPLFPVGVAVRGKEDF
jgi:DNA ligase-1